MRKKTLLKHYCDTSKIKERKAGKYTQFYILIEGKQYSAKTRKKLIEKLFELDCGYSVITLENAYTEWMLWRASINTSSKTLKENKNEWNGFIKDTALAKMQVAKIDICDTSISLGSENQSSHTAAYGDEIVKSLKSLNSLLKSLETAANASPYTIPIGTAIKALRPNFEKTIENIESPHVTLD